jgi:hypothetical protein
MFSTATNTGCAIVVVLCIGTGCNARGKDSMLQRSLEKSPLELAKALEPWAKESLLSDEGIIWTSVSEPCLSGWPVLVDSTRSIVRFQVDGDVFLEYHQAPFSSLNSGFEIEGVGLVRPMQKRLVHADWWLVQYEEI